MNTYKVEIEEVLQKIVEIAANSSDEAVSIARELYKLEEVRLDASDFKEANFKCLTHDSEFCNHEDIENTGYAVRINNGFKNLYWCLDCGTQIYK